MSLILKRASASLLSAQWSEDDYDVVVDSVVVGRIFTSLVAPKDAPWLWSFAHAHALNRRPTNGTAATLDAAMAAFAKSWGQESRRAPQGPLSDEKPQPPANGQGFRVEDAVGLGRRSTA